MPAAAPAGVDRAGALEVVGEWQLAGLCEPSGAARVGDSVLLVDDDRRSELFSLALGIEAPTGATLPVAILPLTGPGGMGIVSVDDLEGVAVIDGSTWLTTSHSRSRSKGWDRPGRQRLLRSSGASASVDDTHTLAFLFQEGDGRLSSLVALAAEGGFGPVDSAWRPIPGAPGGIDAAVDAPDEAFLGCAACAIAPDFVELRPKHGGLDIEGLAHDGQGGLLLGLRGPLTTDGRALVLRVAPPAGGEDAEALAPSSIRQVYGLDLDRRGIRGMDYVPQLDSVVLIAGPMGGSSAWAETAGSAADSPFELRHWPAPAEPPRVLGALPTYPHASPEAVVVLDVDDTEVSALVFYDEGQRVEAETGGCSCADVVEEKGDCGDHAASARARVVTVRWPR